MAGDVDAVREMREANDNANQLRNQYGFAAEFADDDIAYIQRQAEAMRGNVSQGTLPMEGWTGTQWPESPLESDYDLSEYLKRQKAAQLESALAGLKGAYEQSLAGYLSAGERLGNTMTHPGTPPPLRMPSPEGSSRSRRRPPAWEAVRRDRQNLPDPLPSLESWPGSGKPRLVRRLT